MGVESIRRALLTKHGRAGQSSEPRLAEPQTLLLPRELRRSIVDFLEKELPHEGVGLLSVVPRTGMLEAAAFYPGRNRDSSSTRYTMDPNDVLAALRDMARLETRLGAIVHSHPLTPPIPSALDLAEATMPNVLHVIVGFRPRFDLRAWRLQVDHQGRAIDAVELSVSPGFVAYDEPEFAAGMFNGSGRAHRRRAEIV